MQARIKDYPAGPVVAFGGFEYVSVEWRDVPTGFEAQAEQHPYLETKTEARPEPVTVAAEPAKPKRKPVTRKPRRKAAPKGTK